MFFLRTQSKTIPHALAAMLLFGTSATAEIPRLCIRIREPSRAPGRGRDGSLVDNGKQKPVSGSRHIRAACRPTSPVDCSGIRETMHCSKV